MAGMSRKEISRLIDHIEPQGVGVTRTTKGLLLRLPDGTSTMIHFSGSDHRERDNVRARLRRAGLTLPGDKHTDPLVPAITEGKPFPSSLRTAEKALATWNQRYISGAQLVRLTERETDHKLGIVAAQRCLYHLGWTPVGPTKARKWMRPLELEPDLISTVEEEAEAAEPEAEDAEPEAEDAEPEAAVVPPTVPGVREFIDTHDSWAADPDTMPGELTLTQVWASLAALGLKGELRIWRG